MPKTVATARSFLFVPGNRPERFDKALQSGADMVIVDLEDAVPASAKALARAAIAAAWQRWTPELRERVIVRMNACGTPEGQADIDWLPQLADLSSVMVPKAEDPAALAGVAAEQLILLIESAEGLAQLDALARSPGVLRLALGHLDLQADLGMACSLDEAELAPVRLALVMASRRAQLAAPIDGVTPEAVNLECVQADAARSRRFGFTGKLCIHPAQVTPVHAAFAPTVAQLDWAQRVLQAEEAAGGDACIVDGRMVDAPVLKLARQCLALAGEC
jgi:citrate lyase subunit beta/citryl-CoA lyase